MNCNADPSNGYYGNQGALNCLREDGDVAVLEVQYLRGMYLQWPTIHLLKTN